MSTYEHERSVSEFSLGFRFDIVLDGPGATHFEDQEDHR
jgi:protocatechuate 3,4-dioxygenase beta subunit